MDYTRYSSQPATVDLVRADLAETWTIDGFDFESPQRSPSVSRVSDMLDLEYIPTPRPPTSKTTKRDPLPEILGDFLELSPTRKKRQNESQERLDTHKLNPPGGSQFRDSKTNKRKGPNQLTAAADSPIKSSVPKPGKTTTLSTATKGPAKVSNQAKAPPRSLPTRANAKRGTGGDDLFELSDVTDTESESRPKKRQAKLPSPKGRQSFPQRKARTTEKGARSPITRKSKPTPAPKKPSSRDAPRKSKASAGPTSTDKTAHTNEEEASSTPNSQDDELTPTMARSTSNERSRKNDSVFTFQTTDGPGNIASPEPPKPSPVSVKQNDVCLQAPSKPHDVITLSSESADADRAATESNSPMFMDRSQENVPAEAPPDISITINTGLSSDKQSPKGPPVDRRCLGSTPPTSFQPDALGHRHQSIEHCLPARIQEAFFSDEQPVAPSPSPAPESEPNLEECSGVEDIWKQVVEDDSSPAILHRIVTLLHRSLKPREEVIRDIAADYKANASNLLNNLRARHGREKKDTLTALRKASSSSFAIFSGAGQDMAILIDKLRDMDVAHTADTIRRPVLAEKLDSVVMLCQTRLTNCDREGLIGDGVASESDDSLDGLAETYRLRLIETVRQSEGQSPKVPGKVDLQVEDFMKQCLYGTTKRITTPTAKKSDKPARNADEALEVLLDGIINTLQESREGGNPDRAAAQDIDIVSEDSDMGNVDILA
ncbi:uncharacterized protein B0H64DRAFT_334247 [Chaetomium fimeti]|uniref:Uncharacterized protein n=1 Tax=Chaetomium fimeti TaxID=1854472 RepID=A0AAE0HQ89_9PEZI|nr:hypothetical protein B0H64DRAFT_334247 [Chaetomium fimeti]